MKSSSHCFSVSVKQDKELSLAGAGLQNLIICVLCTCKKKRKIKHHRITSEREKILGFQILVKQVFPWLLNVIHYEGLVLLMKHGLATRLIFSTQYILKIDIYRHWRWIQAFEVEITLISEIPTTRFRTKCRPRNIYWKIKKKSDISLLQTKLRRAVV